jgi:hypothetical protein
MLGRIVIGMETPRTPSNPDNQSPDEFLPPGFRRSIDDTYDDLDIPHEARPALSAKIGEIMHPLVESWSTNDSDSSPVA